MLNLSYKKFYTYEGQDLSKKQLKEKIDNGIGNVIDNLFPDATPKQKLKAFEVFQDKTIRSQILFYLNVNIEIEQDEFANILDVK